MLTASVGVPAVAGRDGAIRARPRTSRGNEVADQRPAMPTRLARYARRWSAPARHRAQGLARQRLTPGPRPASYDEGRDLAEMWRWSACYAPLTSLYLDQHGIARACCQNTEHPLGDLGTSTLREIWDGAATAQLRRALERSDLGLGCEFCAWQVAEAGPVGAFHRTYDVNPVGPRVRPRWPAVLEFSVSNTCNLRCVMCNGDWSSAIRSQREHRPPLPSAYPERFYRELVDFIPHLREARFTGGEPFLGREPLRILDLLARHGADGLTLGITTNATTVNDRVERIVRSRWTWINVSLDGGTAEAYERIRVGAAFDEVVANLDRFRALTAGRGQVSISHCLMVDNWETFPELLRLAEGRDLAVSVNTVRFPERHSLYHLLPDDLARVVGGLEARRDEVEATVTGQRLDVWHRQLAALRARLDEGTWPTALGTLPPEQAAAGLAAVPVELGPRRPGQPGTTPPGR